MTPMEAWHIISANLCELYKRRRAENHSYKGYTGDDAEAELITFMALKIADEVNDGLYDVSKIYYVEVIGNIHDHPELLKGGEEE